MDKRVVVMGFIFVMIFAGILYIILRHESSAPFMVRQIIPAEVSPCQGHEELFPYVFSLGAHNIDVVVRFFSTKQKQENGTLPDDWLTCMQLSHGTSSVPFQTLSGFDFVWTDSSHPLGFITTPDVRFNGYHDIQIQSSLGMSNVQYNFWLYDQMSSMFVYHPALSQLFNPTFHTSTQTIESYSNDGCAGSCYHDETLRWQQGSMVVVRKEIQEQNSDASAFIKTVYVEMNGILATSSIQTIPASQIYNGN